MSGTKANIPQFSGNPSDLKSFVDMILKDMTDEQLAYYSYPTYATEGVTTLPGYTLPPSAKGGYDGVGGVSTDLPMPIHIGQSWDRDIARAFGKVKGDEIRGRHDLDDPNSLIFTPTVDIRINPLWGRWFEGFGEDPYLIVELADAEANGLKGDDAFYLKAQAAYKHFSAYCEEWNRFTTTNYLTSRYLREHHFDSALKILEKGNVVGVMTAFGSINGIPFAYTPYMRVLQAGREYALFSYSDFIADYDTLTGLGNGYDETYAKTAPQVAAMLMKARSFSNNNSNDLVTVDDTLEALNTGLLGVTREDLEEQVRPQVELWVRTGYFNQEDYPFADLCQDKSPVDASSTENQGLALEAAEGGIVLLKNDDHALPLEAGSKIVVTGVRSHLHIKPWTSIATPEGIENVGLSAFEALQNKVASTGGTILDGGELTGTQFRVKSVKTGKYFTVDSAGHLFANTTDAAAATTFQVYDWGQDGYTVVDPATNKFLYFPFDGDETDWTMVDFSPSTPPTIISREQDEDGNNFSRYGAIPNYPFQTVTSSYQFYEFWQKAGNYLSVDDDGKLVKGAATGEAISAENFFEFEKVAAVGANVAEYAAQSDTVVVFVGSDPFCNASETTDRKTIYIGEEQIELVNVLAENFDKVVVVINSNLPLGVDAIQNNPAVDAVILTAYGGEFESYALVEALYGNIVPSGRLTSSWLKDMSTLPKLEDKDGIDPQYTVYMKNADAAQLGLTYQYNDPDDLVYPFGYGLSYTTFHVHDISVDAPSGTGKPIGITFTVTNTGDVAGRNVVQVYATSKDSRYGAFVPKKQLIGFEKTKSLTPGESQMVTIEVTPDTLRKWDVTSQEYIVEAGTYSIMIGNSAEDIIFTQDISLPGDMVGQLDITEAKNVWDSCYASIAATGMEVSKKRTADYAGGYIGIMSDEENANAILPNVYFGGNSALELSVAGVEDANTIEVYADSLDGDPIATFNFAATEPVTYYLDDANTISVEELGYTNVTQTFSDPVDTIGDLYIVFKQKGIRIDTIQAK